MKHSFIFKILLFVTAVFTAGESSFCQTNFLINGGKYVQLFDSIAYYEQLVMDKPYFFSQFDTLHRIYSNRWESEYHSLTLEPAGRYILRQQQVSDTVAGQIFKVATPHEKATWNSRKNRIVLGEVRLEYDGIMRHNPHLQDLNSNSLNLFDLLLSLCAVDHYLFLDIINLVKNYLLTHE